MRIRFRGWKHSRSRVFELIAIGSACLLLASLAFVTVTLTTPGHPAVPVQQTGTAAGQPHRVPAAADLGRVVNGKFVSDASSAYRSVAGPVAPSSAMVPGAVPDATRPKPVTFPAQGKHVPDNVQLVKAEAPPQKAGYNQKTSRQLPLANSSQVTYANADGTKTSFQYASPVNFQRADGTWAPISSSLVPAPAGGATPGVRVSADALFETPLTASPSPSVTVSPSASQSPSPAASSSAVASPSASPSPSNSSSTAPAGGWTEKSQAYPETFAATADTPALVTVPVDGSHSLSFGISGAGAVTGAASGSTVSYADARPDSTVSFTAATGLVKESIVLSSPAAPGTWVFPLDLNGLRALTGPGGIVEFADASGKVLAYVPPGFMTDSKIDPHSGDGARSFGVTYSLVTVGGQQAIKMTLDTAWLDSKDRVYPVTVDPSVSDVSANGTTYVQYPDDNDFSGDTEIHVGTWDGGSDKAQSYLAFGNVASQLKNDTVLGARLGVFNTWSYSCSPRPVYVYPVTSSWSVTGAKSWPGPSTGAAIARASFATGWVPLGSTQSPCPVSWEGFNLDQAGTNLVNGWTHGTVADNGLAIGASTSDSYAWKKLASDSSSTGDPFLAITYTTDGASYKLASKTPVANVTPTTAGSFAVTVTNTGASTWTTSNGYQMGSVAYNAQGQQVSNSLVYTAMPSTVAPGQSATVDVKVGALGAGPYRIVIGMYNGSQSFASQGIQDFEIGLYVPEPLPVVTGVYPPTGYTSTTLQQQLSTTATGTGTVTYDFTLTCEPLSGQTCTDATVSSGSISNPYWTPPAADLDWDIAYQWKVAVTATSNGQSATTTVGPVTIEAEPPQPAITSDLGAPSGQAYDPLSGNYTTSATDAAVKSAGLALEVDRTYNSMDPRTSGAFGAGWSSVVDASLENDTSTVLVTMPDGQEMRFGENGDGSYAAPFGSQDALVKSTSGTWTLRDSSADRYAFSSSGQLTSITNVSGYAQNFTDNSSNQVSTITDAISGRSLSLTWSKPSGATFAHVASVTTPAPASGAAAYSWTYAYSGDELTQACAPASSGSECTSYSYAPGSEYQASVLDAGPRTDWQLGEASGATTAADEVTANLGATNGTYHNVTLAQAGPLAGSSESAASFNGTSSYVSLPSNLLTDDTDVSVGLWFKAASGAHGVLFGYASGTISSGTTGAHVPALYIGTNGDLYGEFWTGTASPIASAAAVTDGKWHYVVLTASSSSQTLYLDGAKVNTLSGQVNQLNMAQDTVGAGYWGSWLNGGGSATATAIGYFNGDIGQVAVYQQPLSAATIASQYALAKTATPELTQVTLPSGKTYQQASYDAATARLATYTDPDGGQWTIGQPLATGTKTSSDAFGAVVDNVSVTDPAGRQETYGYDVTDGDRLISFGNGADSPEVYGYDAAGFLTTVVDQDSNLVCLTNDVHGNVLTRAWYPVEPASLPSPGTGANPAACGGSTASSPSCPTSGATCTTFYSYYYNAANPLDPQNDELLTVRDGRSASASASAYETQYAYNTFGQLMGSTTPATPDFPSGRVTRYAYTVGTEPAAGGGTEPPDLLSAETTPGGAKTSYTYDSNGDLAQVTEPSGRYTTYAYDGLGRATTSTVYTSTYSSGEATTYTYTPTGQQSVVTYPPVTNTVANVTHQLVDTYTYDADNDLLSMAQSDAAGNDPARTTSYTYNDHDQVASATQPAGATSGGTAQAGGAASANPAGATTGYDYDGLGNVTQVTDPNGNQYRYSYNEYQEPVQETLYTSSTNASASSATCATPAVQDPDGGCDLVLKSYAYDPAGLLAAQTDAMGRISNYAYDHDQELARSSTTQACSASAPCTSQGPCTPTAQCTTGSVGMMTAYTYDGAGNMITKAVSATSGGGAEATTTTDYNYDAADRLTSEVADATPSPLPSGASASDYQNRTTAYTYNADGKVLSQTAGTGSALDVTDYGYDTAGDETTQTVQDGSSSLETTWTYDQNGLPLSMTTPRGNAAGATAANYTTNYAYDLARNLVAQTGPPVAVSTFASQTATTTRPVTTYGYDTFGDNTQVRDPDGNVTTTGYDGDGRVTSLTQPAYTPPGASASITSPTTYAYDEDGNLTSVTDPNGSVTSSRYDALGDLTSKTDPQLPGQSAPGTSTYTYDADGEQLTAKDPLQDETQRTYDYFGNVATSTDALQNTTRYVYDYLGDQTVADTPSGSVTTSSYDGLGELASAADDLGNTSKYGYDDQGNLAVVTNPDGTSEKYGYDEAGRLTSVADLNAASAQLRSESFGYDADGNQASATNWDGNATTDAYNAAGEMTSQVVPVSSSSSVTTSYGYDAAGNRTSVTGGNQNTTWTTYNSWNLPEKVVEPTIAAAPSTANTTWTTAYGKTGLPATVTEPGGVSLSYGYDPLGDLTSESGSGASASTAAQSFTYDLDGRMASASAPGGTDSFSYYADSRLKNATGPSGASGYTYNSDGLVASETSAAGTASYTYDGADRLATETEPLTGAKLTWGYNSDSNPKSISYATGGTAGPSESLGYDGLQRLTSDTLTSAAGATLASEAYGYDSNGNVTSQTTGGLVAASSQTYGYDEANRLTSATAGGTTTGYGYDGDGNLTKDGAVTDSYNAQDQLTSATGNAGTTSYSYALNGSLSSVTPASGSAQNYTWDAYGNMASADGVSYGYDALGRMVTRTGSAGTTPVSYLGTGTSLASDGTSRYSYDPSGTMTAEGPASGGAGYAVLTDQHGDVAAAFAPTSSASSLEGSSSYSPYGTVTASGSMPGAGYQGDYTDPVTGLVYMNARWYNPATGGFVSSDTAGGTPVPSSVDGNPYAYAGGNPLTETDPTGHCGWCSDLGHALVGLLASPALAPAELATGAGEFALVVGGIAAAGAAAKAYEYLINQMVSGWNSFAHSFEYNPYGYSSSSVSPGGGGSPAPTNLPVIPFQGNTTPGGGPGSGGGGPGTGGSSWVVLAGTCTIACAPPPPPPPQDCYAGPDPTCAVAAPPGSLLHTPLITHVVSNITNYNQLCSLGDCVTEHDKPWHGTVKGTTPGGGSNANTASTDDADQNLQQLLAPVRGQGVQLAPAAGGGAGGGGGLPAPPATSGSCGPQPGDGTPLVPDPSLLSLLPGNNQNQDATSGGQSFTGDTRVMLPGGKTAAISSLKPGDKVLATDTKTGKDQPETVTAVEVHHDTDLYDLTIKSSHGTEAIHTTSSHLFWDPVAKKWVEASKLRKGEHLRTADGGTAVADGGHTPANHQGWMWDLTIPGNNDHDFYVKSAGTAVLVHNCSTSTPALLGRLADMKAYMASKPPGSFDADFLNIRGTMAGGKAGVGGWNWTRNKAFIDDAIAAGREIRMVTDPEAPLYSGGNTYQRELKYLIDNGFGWQQVDDYWQVIRVRPTPWRF